MTRALRYTGVAAVVTLWTTFTAATMAASFDLLGDEPLSYLGTRPPSRLLFTAGMALGAVLFVAFHAHVRRTYPTSPAFSVALLVGMAGQLVAAFVPIGGDPTAHRVHTTFALILGASLPLFMWRFAAAQARGPGRRLAYALFWAEAAACVAGLTLSAAHVAPLAEILPAAVFHAWVLVLTAQPFTPYPVRTAAAFGNTADAALTRSG